MQYKVHELATLAHISVRTLHYYDDIGLLEPSSVAKNGYRYYHEKELIRLQQILFFKELAFSLEDIKRMLNRPDFRVIEALKDQKKLMKLKQTRLDALIKTIDKTIRTMTNNQTMKDEELYDAFKDDDVKKYQTEVKERWGNTDAYKQSQAKVSKMTKKEMDGLKKEGEQLCRELVTVMGKPVDDPAVQALIKKHHEGINFFYPCTPEMYKNLGQMYIDDPRFTAYYDKFAPGLAVFVRNAIFSYVDQKLS
jgi:DNA-binding transcriptional MerR regulator